MNLGLKPSERQNTLGLTCSVLLLGQLKFEEKSGFAGGSKVVMEDETVVNALNKACEVRNKKQKNTCNECSLCVAAIGECFVCVLAFAFALAQFQVFLRSCAYISGHGSDHRAADTRAHHS